MGRFAYRLLDEKVAIESLGNGRRERAKGRHGMTTYRTGKRGEKEEKCIEMKKII